MSIKEIQAEIVDEFSLFDDWMQRYEYIIDLGKSLPLIDEQYKTEDNIIKGCQSKVWLHAEVIGKKVVFTADSDAILTKGIIAILIRTFSNQKAVDILEANTPIEYPDVVLPDGRTVTGDNKLPTEAYIKGFPLVLKKRDDDSKDILYTAYWGHNAANKVVKLIVDGNEIIIKGQYTSVVRVGEK